MRKAPSCETCPVGGAVADTDPSVVRLRHFTVGWYGFFIALVIIMAFFIPLREARRKGMSADDVYGVGICAVLGGIVGARLLHVIDHWPEYRANPSAILAFQGSGLAIHGAIPGGVAAGALGARRRGLSVARIADVAAPGLVVAQAIGRRDCLFNGDARGFPHQPTLEACLCESRSTGSRTRRCPPTDSSLRADWRPANLRSPLEYQGPAQDRRLLFRVYLLLYSALKFVVTFARQGVTFLVGLEAQVVLALGGLVAAALLLWLRGREAHVTAVAVNSTRRRS